MRKIRILTIILIVISIIVGILLVVSRNKKVDPLDIRKEEEIKINSNIYIINESHTGLKKIPIKLIENKKESLLDQSIEKLQRIDNETNKETAKIGNIKILSVKQDKDIAVVNISRESLDWEPSEESLILDSIILSLTDIKGIEKVQILIDGQKTEVFMNAFIISEPLSRDNVTNNIYK